MGGMLTRAVKMKYCTRCGTAHSSPVNSACKRKLENMASDSSKGGDPKEEKCEEEMKLEREIAARAASIRVKDLHSILDLDDEEFRKRYMRDTVIVERQIKGRDGGPAGASVSRDDAENQDGGAHGGGHDTDRAGHDRDIDEISTRMRGNKISRHGRGKASRYESSSSDESDTEDSRKRREKKKERKSKYSIRRHTLNDKLVRNLTFPELIYAACEWGRVDAEEAGFEIDDFKNYLGHISYMAVKHAQGKYIDQAFVNYDKVVRENADRHGPGAFEGSDNHLTNVYFSADYLPKVNKPSSSFSRGRGGRGGARGYGSQGYGNQGNRPTACHAWNYNREGCIRQDCTWDHFCNICKSKDHTHYNCAGKKY